MITVSSVIRERTKRVNDIVSGISKYLNTAQEIITGLNASDYNTATECVEKILTLLAQMVKTSKDIDTGNTILVSCTHLYDDIPTMHDFMSKVVGIVRNHIYYQMVSYTLSASAYQNMQRNRAETFDLYHKYTRDSVEYDDTTIKLMTTRIDISNNINDVYKYVTSGASVNKFTVFLISDLIKIETGNRREKLVELVELQKDISLGAGRINYHKTLVRYNLRPVTKSMPLGSVLSYISNTATNVDDLVKNNNGVIIITNTNNSPMEFDMRCIADKQYITDNKLEVGPLVGLNQAVINKYQTAHMLSASKNVQAIEINGSGTHYWILETISDGLYRLLSGVNGTPTPASDITGLLSGLSTRCLKYNEIMSQHICDSCLDAETDTMTNDFDNSVFPSGDVSLKISSRFTQDFEKYIEEKSNITVDEFVAYLFDRAITSRTILYALPHQTGINVRYPSEYMLAYVSVVDTVISRFYGEMRRQLAAIVFDNRAIKENNMVANTSMFKQIFATVISKSITAMEKIKLWFGYDVNLKEYYMEKRQLII